MTNTERQDFVTADMFENYLNTIGLPTMDVLDLRCDL